MPIYEYRCPACGHEFDKRMRYEDPAPPCPGCGAGDVQKKVSAASFVLAGGGWYKDHYGLKPGGASDGGSGKTPPAAADTAPPTPTAPASPAPSTSGGTP